MVILQMEDRQSHIFLGAHSYIHKVYKWIAGSKKVNFFFLDCLILFPYG